MTQHPFSSETDIYMACIVIFYVLEHLTFFGKDSWAFDLQCIWFPVWVMSNLNEVCNYIIKFTYLILHILFRKKKRNCDLKLIFTKNKMQNTDIVTLRFASFGTNFIIYFVFIKVLKIGSDIESDKILVQRFNSSTRI